MKAIAAADRLAVESIVERLAQAWNSCDAAAFAAQFASDGEQVNIFGGQLVGRDQIERQHAKIFATIFRGSTNRLEVADARSAAPDVIIARVVSHVHVPEGALKGELHTIGSLIFCRTEKRWEIVLFHNTRLTPLPNIDMP